MTAPRTSSDASRAPHSLSLKVLRLARPSLAIQSTLVPSADDAAFPISSDASFAFPSSSQDAFTLTPGLQLPAAFGSVHVGETFACTLCVNNDLSSAQNNIQITDVDVLAEMQTPDQKETPVALELEGTTPSDDPSSPLMPGNTVQRIVRMHLAEEGNYVLFVTVNYVETTLADADGETVSRRRSFRKLYRFPADHLIRVRIKTRTLPQLLESRLGSGYAIEAQLEKLGDEPLLLESVELSGRPSLTIKSLNAWESAAKTSSKPRLEPGDVMQVAFLALENGTNEQEPTNDGKIVLGQMSLRWRRQMGEYGTLNTGWLSVKRP